MGILNWVQPLDISSPSRVATLGGTSIKKIHVLDIAERCLDLLKLIFFTLIPWSITIKPPFGIIVSILLPSIVFQANPRMFPHTSLTFVDVAIIATATTWQWKDSTKCGVFFHCSNKDRWFFVQVLCGHLAIQFGGFGHVAWNGKNVVEIQELPSWNWPKGTWKIVICPTEEPLLSKNTGLPS